MSPNIKFNQRTNRESGVVSLMSVLFFMIFMMIITVGFINIVISEQKQSLDNDLSNSALAAAQSGVEEAKRILLYCHGNSDASCATILDSQDKCEAFKDSGIATDLSIDESDGQGVVGGNSASSYSQYYTCLTIQTKTPFASGKMTADKDYILKLDTILGMDRLKVSWSGSSNLTGVSDLINWPKYNNWVSAPVMQIQLIPYNNALLGDLNSLEKGTKTVYAVPCVDGGMVNVETCNTSDKDINSLDTRMDAGRYRSTSAPVTHAVCTSGSGYLCSVTLGGLDPAMKYYMRASLVYATNTDIEVRPLSGTSDAMLNNVQPWIDVTGRTGDVFRRVRAQVSYGDNLDLPRHALDSAAPICKRMTITDKPETTIYQCP